MTIQTLYDQLLELRIPAFRQALQEQQSNAKYTGTGLRRASSPAGGS